MKKKADKKAAAIANLLESVGKAGGPMEAAKVVDDRAYRRGVRDGKRAQKARDLPVTLIVSGAAAVLAQIPHLVLFLSRRKKEKEAREREEQARQNARLEQIRRELAGRMGKPGTPPEGVRGRTEK